MTHQEPRTFLLRNALEEVHCDATTALARAARARHRRNALRSIPARLAYATGYPEPEGEDNGYDHLHSDGNQDNQTGPRGDPDTICPEDRRGADNDLTLGTIREAPQAQPRCTLPPGPGSQVLWPHLKPYDLHPLWIAHALRTVRRRARLTRSAFARALSIPTATYERWELPDPTDWRPRPSRSQLRALIHQARSL